MIVKQVTVAPDLTSVADLNPNAKLIISPAVTIQDLETDPVADPVMLFRALLSVLSGKLAAQGAFAPHLEHMTIRVPSYSAFVAMIDDYDLIYREVFAGNFPEISLIEDKTLSTPVIQAAALIPQTDPTEKVYGGFTQAEISFQYSPRAQAPNFEEYFTLWREAGPAYQKRRVAELSFGPSKKERIDLFMPEGVDKPPLHVFIHGGYWQAMDKAGHCHMANGLIETGIAVAMVNYDLMPEVEMAEIVRQCRAAMVHLYNAGPEYGYDESRITVSGHSAGGHLSGVLACTNWSEFDPSAPQDLIKGAAPISSLFDLEPLAQTGMKRVLRFTKDVIETWSPIYMTPQRPLPIVLAAGGDESGEFRRQTALFSDHMTKHGCEVTLVDMPGHNHFSIAQDLNDPNGTLTRAIAELVQKT